ncbi:MAG TPA: MarR family transcriptional regulator [Nocardia sp.]|uniref:MarR family winged helix-turn-helix transcriptional regulator n=1 Tax=Nocardia sp. TaxID=1821 RepID=UPI002B4B8274|nr:MarR family transcriptional regulator [Nocardia sp.]HLS76990.1 MarR family transcriptional regulator [Nocardia sp.]
MPVSTETAQDLIKEFYLIGRAVRGALTHPDESLLLPGAIGVLGTLHARGSCRQGDLAGELCISPSALSRHVTELVAAGYITRSPDPSDGRATLVRVTDSGRALLERIQVSRAQGLQEVLTEWDEADAKRACAAMQKLRTSLAHYAQIDNAQTEHAHRSDAGVDKAAMTESQEVDV